MVHTRHFVTEEPDLQRYGLQVAQLIFIFRGWAAGDRQALGADPGCCVCLTRVQRRQPRADRFRADAKKSHGAHLPGRVQRLDSPGAHGGVDHECHAAPSARKRTTPGSSCAWLSAARAPPRASPRTRLKKKWQGGGEGAQRALYRPASFVWQTRFGGKSEGCQTAKFTSRSLPSAPRRPAQVTRARPPVTCTTRAGAQRVRSCARHARVAFAPNSCHEQRRRQAPCARRRWRWRSASCETTGRRQQRRPGVP